MSTTSHNPNDGNVPPAGVPRRQSLTNTESEAGNFRCSQPLSRSILRGGRYGCVHSEVSDDDLITAAQRGDQQAFVELCTAVFLAKKKILRIVQNEEDAEDALGKDGSQFFCDIGQGRGQAQDRDDPRV
jgi:hypothetical protein